MSAGTMLTMLFLSGVSPAEARLPEGELRPNYEPALPVVRVAKATTAREIAIPAGSLHQALILLGKQTGRRVVFNAAVVKGVSTGGVSGAFTTKEALKKLLEGTSLTSTEIGDAGFVVASPYVQTAQAEGVQLPGIIIDGVATDPSEAMVQATGPGDGYIAETTTTGSKTPTDITKIPQSVSVVTRQQLDDRQPAQIEDTLAYTPGVTSSIWGVDDRFDQFLIRGFDVGTYSTYRDGLSQKAIDFSGFKIEPYSVDRVEVFKGPAGVLYGENDVGGLVNVITKRPTFTTFNNGFVSYGSFDTYEAGMDVGGVVGDTKELAFRLTGLYRDGANQIEGSENDRAFIAPALTWRPSDQTTLTILANYQSDKLTPNSFLPVAGLDYAAGFGDLPDRFVYSQSDFNKFDADHGSIGYLFEHHFNSKLTVRQNLRYARQYTDYKHLYYNGMVDETTMDFAAFTVDETATAFNIDNQAQVKARLGAVDNTLLVGFDYSRYEVDGQNGWENGYTSSIFNPNYNFTVTDPAIYVDRIETVKRYGLYVQNQATVFDHWNVTLGLRKSWIENTTEDRLYGADTEQKDDALTSMAGLGYSFDNGLTPYVSYSESFTTNIGQDFYGSSFKPSKGKQYEAGIKFRPKGFNALFTVAAFDITKSNILTSDPGNAFFQVQTGEVNHRGIELEGNFDLLEGLSVTAGYTYLDAIITSSEDGDVGNRAALVPEHQASIWANQKFASGYLEGLSLGAGLRYIGQSFGDTGNTVSVPSYVTVDAAIRYRWDNLEASLNATNLLDKEYYSTCYPGSGCILGERRVLKGVLSAKF